jgi:hypothetical protein
MGHRFICIGGIRLHPGKDGWRYYFEHIFNFGAKHGLEYHGLAMTSFEMIKRYPFKSVDSSTWSRTAAFGMIIIPDVRREKFLNFHVSSRRSSNPNTHHDMSRKQKEQFAELLAFHDFELKEMKDSESARHNWNGFVMSNLDKFGLVQESYKGWKSIL